MPCDKSSGNPIPLEFYSLNDDVTEQENVAEKYPKNVERIEHYVTNARSMNREYAPEKSSWNDSAIETGYVKCQ